MPPTLLCNLDECVTCHVLNSIMGFCRNNITSIVKEISESNTSVKAVQHELFLTFYEMIFLQTAPHGVNWMTGAGGGQVFTLLICQTVLSCFDKSHAYTDDLKRIPTVEANQWYQRTFTSWKGMNYLYMKLCNYKISWYKLRLPTMHKLKEFVNNGFQEFPVGSEEAWVLTNNIHDVWSNNGFVVFPSLLLTES